MTDNEHKNQIGMGLGADAANDAAGEGSGVPMGYHEALEEHDYLYEEYHDKVWANKVKNIPDPTDSEILAAMTGEHRLLYNKCQAIIRHWEENPNG
jgi:hypothetical protein